MVRRGQSREGEKPEAAEATLKQSDEPVVPEKRPKTRVTPVEGVEGRGSAKRKSETGDTPSTQSETSVQQLQSRIGAKARNRPKEGFNNLLSHIQEPLLREAFSRLSKRATPGVDSKSWAGYAEELSARLPVLVKQIHEGSYRPRPVERVLIPKAGGGSRPLGIATVEDKMVQMAVKMLLEPIYEAMFVPFSYGFRPRRSAHDALERLAYGVLRQRVNWVLDADIRAFFDTIEHGWMQKFLEHRIEDKRMVRLLMKMVRAGVMEDGQLHEAKEGTPQGGIISPLLANIYLHYVFDLWIQKEGSRCRGDVVVVRYADDFVIGFEREAEARAMREAIEVRLRKFGLELHAEKSRIVEFGRYARKDRERRGAGKPETFDFLGLTHIAGRTRDKQGFQLLRHTSRKKATKKLHDIGEHCARIRHEPLAVQHAILSRILVGHYNYYAVPTNYRALDVFRVHVVELWKQALRRRSQQPLTWDRFRKYMAAFPLPRPKIKHPWPARELSRPLTLGGSPVREIRSPGSVRGAP